MSNQIKKSSKMKIKNWYYAALILLAMMAGCSKPDDDAELSMGNIDPLVQLPLMQSMPLTVLR
jgi:hypothetical protein